jgi:protein ImuA
MDVDDGTVGWIILYINTVIVKVMNELPPQRPAPVSLEQLLLRDDLWMGHSRYFTARAAIATGFNPLDEGLLNRGWPVGSLIEVCQNGIQGEWQLFTPALSAIPGLIVLLNPPANPFCQAFIQGGIDLERLIVVEAAEKNNFMACFIEMTRASVGAVLAWQPRESMTYTELRKCLLATSDGNGLCVMFRPSSVQQQSSPAALRLFAQLIPAGLEISVFKQKGHLQTKQSLPIVLPLPDVWAPAVAYAALGQQQNASEKHTQPRIASVTPLRGKS